MEPVTVADALCRRAGIALEKPLPVTQLVATCLGPRATRTADPGTLHGHSKLVRVGNTWRIYIQRGIPQRMEVAGILRCLVEWELLQVGYEAEDRSELIEAAGTLLEAAVDLKQLGPKKATKGAGGAPRRAAGGHRPPRSRRTA